MKKLLLLPLFYLILVLTSQAQQRDPYDYNTEFIWGVNKNTAGGWIGGFVFKYSKRLNERMFESYGVELMNVKHPKEHRYNQGGSYFIYGKLNYLYAVRLQYGRELVLFKKDEEQGVEIKAAGSIGPTIGVVTPYYINLLQGNGTVAYTNSVPYDPSNNEHTFANIYGPGRLFQGLGDSKIQPGVNIKVALNFEMGAMKSHVTGFELGFLLDAYTKEVELMAYAQNKAVFPTAFITLYYGSRK